MVIPFTKKKSLPGMKQLKLYGRALETSNDVKYLGVTLDKELNWKKHADLTITKALRVFGMCRSAYGKTWGLNPKVLKWIYTTMVRPIILYGSLAWWPRTLKSTCKDALTRVQRTACMAIAGAFKTTPTAALEILLDLPPLHLVIQSEARKSLHRMAITGLWSDNKPKTKHTNMDTDSFMNGITNMSCDKMQPKFVFHKNFKIEISSRAKWAEGLKPPISNGKDVIWYTDGSKIGASTGAGIYADDHSSSISMGNYATVFQAETYAIIACAQENIDRHSQGKNIYILSDSQASLKALRAPKVESRLVYNAVQVLNRLGRRNRVHLVWIPGHEGFIGNENADELARGGSMGNFVGPEPFVGLSQGTIATAIKTNVKLKHQQEWSGLTGLRHSKLFMHELDSGWSKKLWKLSRRQLRIITGVFTGHYGVRGILAKMRLTDSTECRLCGEEDETMKHVMCECHALARQRLKDFGAGYLEPKDFRALPLSSIIRHMEMVERALE